MLGCSLAQAAVTSLNPADPARTLVGGEERAVQSIQSGPEDLGQSTIAFQTIVSQRPFDSPSLFSLGACSLTPSSFVS